MIREAKTVLAALLFCAAIIPHANAGSVEKIEIIVPMGKGGALDGFARSTARFLESGDEFDIDVVNFPPKSGKHGYTEFMERPRDGSSVLAWFQPGMAASDLDTSIEDLEIINVQEVEPAVLAVHKDVGWKTLRDMIEAVRKNPHQHRIGLGSRVGGGSLLALGLFKNLGLDIAIVDYPSGGKARKALKSKEVELTAGSMNAIRKLGDDVIPLAVFSPRRMRALPDVPTINEALGSERDHAVTGAVYRFFAVPKAFAEAEPEKFQRLVAAFRGMTKHHEGFKKHVEKRGIGAHWFGPIESRPLLINADRYFRKLIHDIQ